MYRQQNVVHQQYRQTQVMSSDPLQLVIMTYDLAIAGCREKNLSKVASALNELRGSLDHEAGGQIAADLLGLYIYLAEEARQGNYEAVGNFLWELRDTWSTARERFVQQPQAMALSLAA
ncbi:MAG: flagellar export chaperone FliS [Caldilineaceae bacterium]